MIMSRDVLSIDKDQRLKDALKLMEKTGVDRLIVTEDGRLFGIITARDISKKLGSYKHGSLPSSRLHVSTATTVDPITIGPEASVFKAAEIMIKNGISGIPVISGEEVVGIITKTDITRFCTETNVCPVEFYNSLVKDIMTRDPITVSPWDRVVHARRILLDNNISRLPVIEDGLLVGLVSERDIARTMDAFRKVVPDRYKSARVRRLLVEDIMTQNPTYTTPNTRVYKFSELLLKSGISGAPVLEENRLVGIATKTDIVRLFLKEDDNN